VVLSQGLVVGEVRTAHVLVKHRCLDLRGLGLVRARGKSKGKRKEWKKEREGRKGKKEKGKEEKRETDTQLGKPDRVCKESQKGWAETWAS
jgi:hypothetical protein